MQIFAKTLTGKTIVLEVNHFDEIYTLKCKIFAKEYVPVHEQKLVFSGKVMDNDKTVTDYNIQPNSTINILLRLRGGL